MRWMQTAVALLGVSMLTTPAAFASTLNGADCPAPECAPTTRTIRVPEWTTETRTITVTECRPETRTKTITDYRCEPYTATVGRPRTVYETKQRTRTVRYVDYKPVMQTVNRPYVVCTPQQVERQAVRHVCHMVPTTVERTVCEDHGHWAPRPQTACTPNCCGLGCAACCGPAQVWVPNVVQRKVACTVMRPKFEPVKYTYMATVMKREVHHREAQVCRMVPEHKTREVTENICVPKQVMETCQVTRYRRIPEQREIQCTVMVPHRVQKEIQVPVCHWVEKTVTLDTATACVADCCERLGLLGRFRLGW